MSKFSQSLWSYLVQRRYLSTQQFEAAVGMLFNQLPPLDDEYNEFRSARNILRLWHSAGWLDYDYETQKVVPCASTLVSYLSKSLEYVNLVAVDETSALKFKDKYGASFDVLDLDQNIEYLYPPIYNMPLKLGMVVNFKADDLLKSTPGINDILSEKIGFGAEYANVHIVDNQIPKLVDLEGRRKFYYDVKDLCFKEGDLPPGNFFIRYQSAYNFKTDCIWRNRNNLIPIKKQFRIIKEWAWGIHMALAEAYGSPSTVMYDPIKKVMACYMITPLPRAISRLLSLHGGRPQGFIPRWFDPLRGARYSLCLYYNVSYSMAYSVATKLGFIPDKKPLRLILL